MRKILVLFAFLCALAAGCAPDPEEGAADASVTEAAAPAGSETTTSETIAVPDVVGKDLQLAQDTMQAAGLYNLTSRDSTGQGRLQLLDRNWKVIGQVPAPGTEVDPGQRVNLRAEKVTDGDGQAPPERITVPDVEGMDLQLAQDTLQAAGLYNLTSHDSTGQGRMRILDRNWKVTGQSPSPGTTADPDVRIDLGAKKFTD